ncbi:hypothetical protein CAUPRSCDRAFT_12309 [Caulochytrium protostelioides]|uniref:Hydrophobin n=1 Tax=Caulochytrium protostelioides TaxID=1555241 RepID=A0A4V1IT66_9FUNG|nr:hypothetical protein CAUPRSCDRAFT_12309 [Caulochytrium protostelioides]
MLLKTLFWVAAGAATALAQEAPAGANAAQAQGANEWNKHPSKHQNTKVHVDDKLECASHQKSYCCTQTVAPDAPGVGVLASLANNLFLGLECVPVNINLLAWDTTSQCSGSVVCCAGSEVDGGKMVVGCDAPLAKGGRRTRL